MSALASEQPTSQQQPAEDATPHWFFTSNNLTSVGERREEAKRAQVIGTLSELFPRNARGRAPGAIAAGGDLTTIVDRLLASQFAEPEAPMAAASSSAGGASSSSSSSGAGPSARPDAMASDDIDGGGSADGPKRRVRFAPKLVEQMTIEEEPAGGTPCRSTRRRGQWGRRRRRWNVPAERRGALRSDGLVRHPR